MTAYTATAEPVATTSTTAGTLSELDFDQLLTDLGWGPPARLVAYVTAHGRIRRYRGWAYQYDCIDCGEQASEWSYNNVSPVEQTLGGSRWSSRISDYDPRCTPCHVRFDNAHDRARKEAAS